MRALFRLLTVIALAQMPLFAGSKSEEPHCAFSDEPFMTMLTITSCATEYFASHHAWPTTTQHLRTQLQRTSATTPSIAEEPTAKDIDQFFARFSQIELKPQGRDLLLSARYRAEGKVYSHRILLHPGKNTDEMLQASTEVK
jgi:hypothetical protein